MVSEAAGAISAKTDTLDILGGETYVRKQIKKHLGMMHDLEADEMTGLESCIPQALSAVRLCWSQISNKYYNRNGVPTLDVNNSNQYCQLLLILARQASAKGFSALADKIFGLNKMLNSCDIYHEVVLPRSFYIDHSLGIVVGRAKLGERLFLSQNSTIGSNPGQYDYPELGTDNYLMAGATIVGKVRTGDRVIFGAGSYVKDIQVPSDTIVFGRTPDNVFKPLRSDSFVTASPFVL